MFRKYNIHQAPYRQQAPLPQWPIWLQCLRTCEVLLDARDRLASWVQMVLLLLANTSSRDIVWQARLTYGDLE
jgi:hypothetical protein